MDMKRDLELIRNILIYIEDYHNGANILHFEKGCKIPEAFGECSYTAFQEHVKLITDNGLIESRIKSDCINLLRLTWAGHDFLAASRGEGVWEKAKKTGVHLAFSAFVDNLTHLSMEYAKTLFPQMLSELLNPSGR
jgi:hypothetical protein